MSGGSQQLRLYRVARRNGADRAAACASSGIDEAEAKLIDAEDAKNPPSEDAYALLGHNSGANDMADREEGMGGGQVAADELRLLIERAERLEEEKKGIAEDIKDVMAEAKSRGFDVKAIRKIIAIRKKKREEFEEEQAILDVYMNALGMLADTPLGQAALHAAASRTVAAVNAGALGPNVSARMVA